MRRLLPTLLVTATVMTMSAKAADEPPSMKAPPSNSSDLGAPDPLNVLDDRGNQPIPPPEVPTMPEFKEVPAANGDSSGGEDGGSKNAETPPPADNPETSTPKPKKTKKKRTSKSSARAAHEESYSTTNLSPDAADERREQAFHTVYEKYNAAPTPMEAWEQASAARTSEVYKVQKNDTLWDLSKTLFGDPNYWPKIWALNNDEVLNPHEIETWMQIRFYPGDLNEPPTVAVSETPKLSKNDKAEKVEESNLPPPRRIHPLVRRLPPSIPQWKTEAARKVLPPLEGVQPRRIVGASTASLTYSVSETAVNGVGSIKETELGTRSASEFQYVFADVADSSTRIFTVVKEIGTLSDPRDANSDVKRPIHLIEYQGEIEIVEPVSDHGNLQRAIVRKNLTPIEVGSRLIPGRIETVNIEDGAPTSGPGAQIIGSQFNARRVLTDAGGFVFINAGSLAGVQPGMILPVFSNVRLRNPGTGARIHDREVAHAKVVKVTENYATAVLTKVSDDVMIGDSVGASATGNGTGESLSGAPVAPESLPGGGSKPDDAVVPADRASAAPSGDDLDFGDDESMKPAPATDPSVLPSSSGSDDDLEL